MIRLLVLVALCNFHAGFAVIHTWTSCVARTTGVSVFPEFVALGMLDDIPMVEFDSWTSSLWFYHQWIENVEQPYIDKYKELMISCERDTKFLMSVFMQLFNQSGGIHTIQIFFGCVVDEDGNLNGQVQYGYDGEDFLSLDMNTVTWVAAKLQALVIKQEWDSGRAQVWKGIIDNRCIEVSQRFIHYGRESLERKVPPEVSLLRRDPSSPVTCLATGFFPKRISVSWEKDGEDLHEDVELLETVSNEDGTFQTRSRLTVSPADLKKHKFTCIVDHSSLEKKIIKPVTEEEIKTNLDPGNSTRAAIIVGVVVPVLVLAIIATVAKVILWKNRKVRRLDVVQDTDSSSSVSDTSSNSAEKASGIPL